MKIVHYNLNGIVMKIKSGVFFIFILLFTFLMFSSCSVDETDESKIKAMTLYVSSSKSIVSKPANYMQILDVSVGDEWYEYSELEIIAADGTSSKVKDFHFDQSYSVPVMTGTYTLTATVIMTSRISAYATGSLKVHTYRGSCQVVVPEDLEIVNTSLTVSEIYNEVLDADDYLSVFQAVNFFPGTMEVRCFLMIPDGTGIIKHLMKTDVFNSAVMVGGFSTESVTSDYFGVMLQVSVNGTVHNVNASRDVKFKTTDILNGTSAEETLLSGSTLSFRTYGNKTLVEFYIQCN